MYLIQISFLVAPQICVHVTWASYFITYESAPGRLSPIVTVILALINTIMKLPDLGNQSMAYTTIFEVYVITCLFQVFFKCKRFFSKIFNLSNYF